ncbi:MAG: hypothetical protein WBN04_16580, partial [Paracoccaceae bacterium]
MLKPDLVNLISAGYAAFLQPARTPDSVITPYGDAIVLQRLGLRDKANTVLCVLCNIMNTSELKIMIKVGIVGGTGYTGVELLRLLAVHPGVNLTV